VALVSVAWAFEPIAVAPSLVACAHKPEPVASTPLTLLHVDATTLLIALPLVPRVCTVPLLLAPPIVVPPSVPPFAVAFFDASTSDVSVVDKEVVPLAMLLRPLEIEVIWLRPVDSDEMPVEREEIPLEVDDDKELTLPLVVDSPVDRELTFDVPLDRPVDSELMLLVLLDKPVEADADNELTLLLVELNPVDSEPRPVEVEVDNDDSWLKFTASVGFTPAATFVRITGVVAPTPPKVMLV
jgi:hypothetical protein